MFRKSVNANLNQLNVVIDYKSTYLFDKNLHTYRCAEETPDPLLSMSRVDGRTITNGNSAIPQFKAPGQARAAYNEPKKSNL